MAEEKLGAKVKSKSMEESSEKSTSEGSEESEGDVYEVEKIVGMSQTKVRGFLLQIKCPKSRQYFMGCSQVIINEVTYNSLLHVRSILGAVRGPAPGHRVYF